MNKMTRLYPDTEINSSLTNYALQEQQVSFVDFIRANLVYIIAGAALIIIAILLLVLRNVRVTVKEEEGRRIISEAERDPLTKLYNWNFFLVYSQPGFAVNTLRSSLTRLRSISTAPFHQRFARREYGDSILRELGGLIENSLTGTEGIAGRSHADLHDLLPGEKTGRLCWNASRHIWIKSSTKRMCACVWV